MHALYALDGLKALDVATVLHGLHDPDAQVREHALRLAEPFESAPGVRARFEQMTDDPDLRVRYQLAFSLGSVRGETPSREAISLSESPEATRSRISACRRVRCIGVGFGRSPMEPPG